MRRRPALLVATVLFALGIPLPARAASYGAVVEALDNVFAPQIVRIDAGDSVEWVMDGRAPHTVTADDGSWDSGDLQPGTEFDRVFDQPGVYTYYCVYHGSPGAGMIGTVVVGDVPLPGSTGGVGPGEEPAPSGYAATLRVPGDHATIQQAVDHAKPGGMVLIEPGTYRETVTVTTPFITIRGVDRNRTIIDGEFERANGVQVIEADGVTIQNLTARNHLLNGF
jgi:plastocyanin